MEMKSRAVFWHDVFNLLSLSALLPLIFLFLWKSTDFTKIGTSQLASSSDEQAIFDLLFQVLFVYITADTVWIAIQPSAVLSNPKALVIHHLAVMAFMSVPWFYRQFSWHIGLSLLPEINTFFLVGRRQFSKDSFMFHALNYAFLGSWIAIRLVLYPIMVVFYSSEYLRFTWDHAYGNYINLVMIAPVLQILLTIMGFKWTYDIIAKNSKVVPVKGDNSKEKKLT